MYSVVLVTVASAKEGKKIALTLLKNKYAACINIIPKVESFFWWKGKIDQAQEGLLVIKTHKSKVSKVIKKVTQVHSYEVCEVISLVS